MVLKLKLRKVGNSAGLILPKRALARLNADVGDTVRLTDLVDGGFRLNAANPDLAPAHAGLAVYFRRKGMELEAQAHAQASQRLKLQW